MRYLKNFSTRITPQSQPIAGTVPNSAGGFAFPVDDWTRLERFLILGAEGGTYYIGERTLTRENAEATLRCIASDGPRVVDTIVAISDGGRASKNDPALFALALAAKCGDEATRQRAYASLPRVARTGTHLFHFVQYCEQFGGWGSGLVRAVRRWYLDRTPDELALQLVKYQQRDGWSHRDLLRLTHPKAPAAHSAMFGWVVRQGAAAEGGQESRDLPRLIAGTDAVRAAQHVRDVVELIRMHRLPREVIPTEWLSEPTVWEALLEDMPMTAMVRNLATMTRVGLILPNAAAAKTIVTRLDSQEAITRARVHPIALLAALKTYQSGHGARNAAATWEPVTQIVDALDGAFYKAFTNVAPSGKRLLLALDVSGSMTSGRVGGVPGLTPRAASAAMALVTAAVEPHHEIVGFTSGSYPTAHSGFGVALTSLDISPKRRLDDVIRYLDKLDFGGTDCALPMIYAREKRREIDAFVVYTDSETWAGNIHPVQALNEYRRSSGIAAKSVVVGMVSNGFTIADPNDGGMMDVVGFDTNTPAVIADFVSTHEA